MFGEQIVATKFRQSASVAANVLPAFRNVEEYLYQITQTQFNSQGRRAGGSWKKLSAEWLARKARMGRDTRILQFDHALIRSVTKKGARGQILEHTPTSLTFGTELPYAARHQFGHERTPQRKFLVVRPSDRAIIAQMIQDHMMTPWVKTGVLAFGGGRMLRGPRGRFVGIGR